MTWIVHGFHQMMRAVIMFSIKLFVVKDRLILPKRIGILPKGGRILLGALLQ